ncbi:MAG: membrane-associated phospholipid phosphatase [Salibacteraceae bacterium]
MIQINELHLSNMKKTWQSHWIYFTIYMVFAVISCYYLLQFSKQEIHLFLNSFHRPFNDLFFKSITYIGDGITIVIIVLFSLFWSKRYALQIGLSGIVSGLIAQVLKKVVFGPTPRPSKYFNDLEIPLHYVKGVELHTVFSFPSGHATAVFALTTSILLNLHKKQGDLSLIILAILTAYSRIYLSQHFLSDVLFGSFIGITVALLVNKFLNNTYLRQKKTLDKPLINLMKN